MFFRHWWVPRWKSHVPLHSDLSEHGRRLRLHLSQRLQIAGNRLSLSGYGRSHRRIGSGSLVYLWQGVYCHISFKVTLGSNSFLPKSNVCHFITFFSPLETRMSSIFEWLWCEQWSHSVSQTLMNVSRPRTLAPTGAATFPAASGACVLRVRCFSETDAPAQAWRGGPSLATVPESGRGSALSWCPLWEDQSCPGLRGHLASPGRAVR